jgi:type III restriction enzyme
MPTIKSDLIIKSGGDVEIGSGGITVNEHILGREMDMGDFENLTYPDVLRRLQDNTQLLRKTILEILRSTKRFDDFFKNPEVFISRVSTIINEVKRELTSEGLQYFKLDEEYVQTQIFDDSELFGYKDYNVLDISDRKNVFDHVIFDSIIEKQFALDAEKDNDVVLYAKLPSEFKIDTPFGKYNPDWVVVIQKDNDDRLYFVAETKGTSLESSLRGSEMNKINSGRKHFEIVDSELKYELTTSLKMLKREM